MPHPFNQHVVDEFRARGGRVGGPFAGAHLLLLTTTGARTGRLHTTPVGRLTDDGGRTLVIASAGGAPDHPQWFPNLLADPHVTVEDGTPTWPGRAVVLEGPERDAAFARAAAADPGWAAHQERTARVLPVVVLEPR
ncbi:nitroreductase/quinone reductase family protein [Geodermatophilus sp. URMC 63]